MTYKLDLRMSYYGKRSAQSSVEQTFDNASVRGLATPHSLVPLPGTARRGLATPHSLVPLHPAQPEEVWPPLIAWFLSRFLPRFWPFYEVIPSHRASTPALLAVWGFRLGFCTALWDIRWCRKGFINTFDLIWTTCTWIPWNPISNPSVF